MPDGFQLKGHRWSRHVGAVRHQMDLEPMKSLRGLGPVWFRIQLAVDLGEHGPAGLWNKTLCADGLNAGAELVFKLPRECDDDVVESTAQDIRAQLPLVLTYFQSHSTPEQFLAALAERASMAQIEEARAVFRRLAGS